MKRTRSKKTTRATSGLSTAKLAEMIEEATVDAHDQSEQAIGWFTVLENNLDLPFDTDVLGVSAIVDKIVLRNDHILAVCRRGRQKQLIAITDLPQPTPRPPRCVQKFIALNSRMIPAEIQAGK